MPQFLQLEIDLAIPSPQETHLICSLNVFKIKAKGTPKSTESVRKKKNQSPFIKITLIKQELK